MKKILILLSCLFAGTSAFAQNRLGANFGASRSALNLGVTYDAADSTGSGGGHFLFQSEKSSSGIPGLMSFAGHIKMNLLEQNKFSFDAYPGAGIHIFKSNASDKATVGPSLRLRAAYRLSNGVEIGIDHIDVYNWLDENAPANATLTALVFKLKI